MTYSYGFPWMLSRHLCLLENLSALQSTLLIGLHVSSDFCLGIVWVEIGGVFLLFFICCYISYPQRYPVVSTSQQAEVAETSGGTDGSWHDVGVKMATRERKPFLVERNTHLYLEDIVVSLQLLSVLFGLFNFEFNRNLYNFGNGPPGKKLGQVHPPPPHGPKW